MKERNLTKSTKQLKKGVISLAILGLLLIIGGILNSHTTVNTNEKHSIESPKRGKPLLTAVKIPDAVFFAGERMPLENFDVKESLDRELLVNANFHSQTFLYLKKMPRYFQIIEPILKAHNIPDDFKFLAVAESGLNDRIVSPAGAVGIWQFMKSTAIEYGLEVNNEIDERYHLEKATVAACNYLNKSYQKYGSWALVAATYNAGHNGIARQITRQKSDSYYDLLLNDETARYVYRIVALKLILSNPADYGFRVTRKDFYPELPTTEFEITGAVENFADFAHQQGINYKILKYFNPWLRQAYLKNPKKKKYILKLPAKGLRNVVIKPEVIEVADSLAQ